MKIAYVVMASLVLGGNALADDVALAKKQATLDLNNGCMDESSKEEAGLVAADKGYMIFAGTSCGGNAQWTGIYRVKNGEVTKILAPKRLGDMSFMPMGDKMSVDLQKKTMTINGVLWAKEGDQWNNFSESGDPHCCPSLTATMTIDLQTGKDHITDIRGKDGKPYRPETQSTKPEPKTPTVLDVIIADCSEKWGRDYRMVEYCSKTQSEAYINIQKLKNR